MKTVKTKAFLQKSHFHPEIIGHIVDHEPVPHVVDHEAVPREDPVENLVLLKDDVEEVHHHVQFHDRRQIALVQNHRKHVDLVHLIDLVHHKDYLKVHGSILELQQEMKYNELHCHH